MIVQPLHSKVLVAENNVEYKSEAGILLDGADSVRQTAQTTVLAIGPKVTEVKVGDVVFIDWSKGTVVSIDGYQRVMVDESNIIMVLE